MSQPLFRLTGYRDDFGAVYIGGRGLPEESVLEWTRAGLEKIFPRMILDPARGLVMLMSPGRAHEDAAGDRLYSRDGHDAASPCPCRSAIVISGGEAPAVSSALFFT